MGIVIAALLLVIAVYILRRGVEPRFDFALYVPALGEAPIVESSVALSTLQSGIVKMAKTGSVDCDAYIVNGDVIVMLKALIPMGGSLPKIPLSLRVNVGSLDTLTTPVKIMLTDVPTKVYMEVGVKAGR